MCGKLKLKIEIQYPFCFTGSIIITILLRTVTSSSDAIPFSSVTICCTFSRTCWKPELKDLVTYRNVTSQEAECFERWPGWDEVNGDGRTLQHLCFYSRTPMTSQAMLALFPDIPEFRTWIVSLRTFSALFTSTVIVLHIVLYIYVYDIYYIFSATEKFERSFY